VKRVLIIEDDAALANGLQDNLAFEGYATRIASTGTEGLIQLRREPFDLVLLDLMLPGISGFDVLRRLPEVAHRPRVIVVSARDAESDIVRALDLGAHDYVRKPFGLAELLARVKAQLRAQEPHDGGDDPEVPDEYAFADVRIAFRRFRLWKRTSEHLLSHTEVQILKLFIARPDQPLKRSEIIAHAWGDEAYPTERTVDNFILKLRKKLEDDPQNPRFLQTVHRVGYRFTPQG
jgi:DNA-binding response OmpR family regulator